MRCRAARREVTITPPMENRLTNLLLGALLIVSIFGFALHQHEAQKTRRLLDKALAAMNERGPALAQRNPAGLGIHDNQGRASDGGGRSRSLDGAGQAGGAKVRQPTGEPLVAVAPSRTNGDDDDGGGDPRSNGPPAPGGGGGGSRSADDRADRGPDGSTTDRRTANPTMGSAEDVEATPSADGGADGGGDPGGRPDGTRDDAETWNELSPLVRRALSDLMAGRYGDVTERFTGELRGVLTEQRLRKVLDPIRAEHGGFTKIASHSRPATELEPGLEAFNVLAETERGEPLQFIITFDQRVPDGPRIAGLFLPLN